jgi:O-antigen ligase
VNAGHGIVWRSRSVRYALVALPAWFTVAVLVFHTPWRLKLVVGGFFAAALWSPVVALVALAAVVPLGRLIGIALDLHTFRLTEALVVAFLAGWLLRDRTDAAGPRAPAAAGWLAALAIVGSMVGQAWTLAAEPGQLAGTIRILYQAYYIVPDRIGFDAAARLLEGIALVAAMVTLFRLRPQLAVMAPVALSVGAMGAACSSLLLARQIGLPQVIAESAGTAPRLSAHVGDVNAAGSYFAMMLLVALGLAAHRRGAWSIAWLACAATDAAALWLTGSRSAIAAAAIAGTASIIYVVAAAWSRSVRRAALAIVVGVAVLAGGVRAWTLRRDAATDFRRDFYATSARMIAARPLVGVGIGQYYDSSPLFLSRFLGWFYGFENAHNFFLQLAAELGITGALPLLALFATGVGRGARAILVRPDDLRLVGCVAGTTALLATCLTGHPLLLDEVAFPFWILLGLVVAIGGAVVAPQGSVDDREGRRRRPPAAWAALAATAAVLLVYAAGARRPLRPSEAIAVTGLEPWEAAPDGTRYRWTLDYASVFVPRAATRVYIPVRLPADLPRIAPMGVQVRAAGIDRGRTLVGSSWVTLDVELPPLDTRQLFRRIDLKVDRTWQPAIYIPGSRDLRRVGVQLGEVKATF